MPMKEKDNRQLSLRTRPVDVQPPKPGRPLRTVGLFAGIGGIELGLQKAGHETALLCEIEAGALAVLNSRFSDIPKHTDICTLSRLPRGTELVVAGFPCQDLSQAGKTAGIEGTRSGLVHEVFRLLKRQPVPWLLLENVPFMLQLAGGRALEVIISALEESGYRWAYRVVDSRAFGLPQRRERVYLLASLEGDPRTVLYPDESFPPHETGSWRDVACGFYWTEGIRGLGWAVDAVPTLKGGSTIGIPSSPGIILPSADIVKPDIRDAERMQGFPVDWTKPSERVMKRGHRWKLVGNAVTVDASRWIGERLLTPGSYDGSLDASLLRKGAWPRAAWSMGNGRFVAERSAWPVARPRTALQKFLKYPTEPLSIKATAGFLSRARSGSLRFPEGFLDAVEAHLERMQTRRSA